MKDVGEETAELTGWPEWITKEGLSEERIAE